MRQIPLTAMLLLAGCSVVGVGDRNTRQELEHEKSAWLKMAAHNYSYDIVKSCECPGVRDPVTITVRADTIETMIIKPTGLPAPADPTITYYPLTELYDYLIGVASQADGMTVLYDRANHVPITVSIDFSRSAVDDELGLTISSFRRQ